MRFNPSLAASVFVPVLFGFGCATAGQQRQATMHDPENRASLEAFVRTGMDELSKGNMLWWGKTACPQAVMWDGDPTGNTTAARGKAEIDAALAEAQKMINASTQFATTTTNVDCRTTSLSGHCLVEFEQSVTQGGKTMGPFKFRGTLIAERNGEGWIWSHWHGSLAPGSAKVSPEQAAAMAAPAPAAAAPAAPATPAAPAAPAAPPAAPAAAPAAPAAAPAAAPSAAPAAPAAAPTAPAAGPAAPAAPVKK
jgi:hypothetical protein